MKGNSTGLTGGRRAMGLAVMLAALLVFSAGSVYAIPTLQLYIEGAEYETATETWVIEATGEPFNLWVIGDVGSYGDIYDLKLAAAVYTDEISEGGSISLSPTTTALLDDPSTPSEPVVTSNFPSSDGALPQLGDGSDLPPHGAYTEIFGEGVSFFEWSLGDFTLTDSPIGDFIGDYPTSFPSTGQVNVYSADIDGFSMVHFDAYDHIYVDSHAKYVFAPFSHDAATEVPEPSTLSMLIAGCLLCGIGMAVRRGAPRLS